MLEQHRDLLKQGTMLVDPHDAGEEMRRALLSRTHHSGRQYRHSRQPRDRSRASCNSSNWMSSGTHAPSWLCAIPRLSPRQKRKSRHSFEPYVLYPGCNAIWKSRRAPTPSPIWCQRHLAEVRSGAKTQIDKTQAAVNERLTNEISYWDNRAVHLKEQESAGQDQRPPQFPASPPTCR